MESSALKVAIELTLMPSRVRGQRDAPLPHGVPLLLRIAAGDEAAEMEAMQATERPAQIVRESAAFFIEQMLLHPEADSYRVLGTTSAASTAELRQNMAWLMRWLHPDKNSRDAQAIFVGRVNRAWDDLKTAERRQAYDRTLASRPVRRLSGTSSNPERERRSGSASSRGSGLGKPGPLPGHRRRKLQLSDILGPSVPGRTGLIRRMLGKLLRLR